jgi:hypothetical protein
MNYRLLAAIIVSSIAALSGGFYYLLKVDLLGGRKYLKNASRAFEDVEIRSTEYGIKYINA